jgi:hypothetical protein
VNFAQRYVRGSIPERFVEVDAARLLLILHHFSSDCSALALDQSYFPAHDVERHLTPEYYLQKLDFLVRYPGYFAYEVIELHRLGVAAAGDRDVVRREVRTILINREPELRTQPFRRFWYGAHERLDVVEAWWHARGLVFTTLERRRDGKPQKHFFLTKLAAKVAHRLVQKVEHAKWYDDRITLIKTFFGALSANEIRNLQYSHPTYREAQLSRAIPDLPLDDVIGHYQQVMGEPFASMKERSYVR